MDEVDKIRVTEEKIAAAESNGDIARRDRLEMELQRKVNLLQQAPAPPPGDFIERISIFHICILFSLDEFHLIMDVILFLVEL